MNSTTMRAGAVGGMLGGAVMAMWSMVVLWATGDGFWTPLNLIAHTVWRSAPIGASFSVGALIIGMVVHMMMSMLLGVGLAVTGARAGLTRPVLVAASMVAGLMLWVVMQYGAWQVVDPTAADAFTPWVFAVAHLMYGAVTGAVIARAVPGTVVARRSLQH